MSLPPQDQGRTSESSAEARPDDPFCLERAPGSYRLLDLHFRDTRPPLALVNELEKELRVLFSLVQHGGLLRLRAQASVTGARYDFELCYEAALAGQNAYRLRLLADWANMPATHHDYYSRNSLSWFELWTRAFTPSPPVDPSRSRQTEYQQRSEALLRSRQALVTVEQIQAQIVEMMKAGATFRSSHKEGGSVLAWQAGAFVRTDFGDTPGRTEYRSAEDFLAMLRRFLDFEVRRNAVGGGPSEQEAWTLILRLLGRSLKPGSPCGREVQARPGIGSIEA